MHGLLDGELDAANAMRCEEHLARCATCATEYSPMALCGRLSGPAISTKMLPRGCGRVFSPSLIPSCTPTARWQSRPVHGSDHEAIGAIGPSCPRAWRSLQV